MKKKRETNGAASTHKRPRNDGDSVHSDDDAVQPDGNAAAGINHIGHSSCEEETSAARRISAEGGSSIIRVEPIAASSGPAGPRGTVSASLNETLKALRRRTKFGSWELPLLPEVEKQRM